MPDVADPRVSLAPHPRRRHGFTWWPPSVMRSFGTLEPRYGLNQSERGVYDAEQPQGSALVMQKNSNLEGVEAVLEFLRMGRLAGGNSTGQVDQERVQRLKRYVASDESGYRDRVGDMFDPDVKLKIVGQNPVGHRSGIDMNSKGVGITIIMRFCLTEKLVNCPTRTAAPRSRFQVTCSPRQVPASFQMFIDSWLPAGMPTALSGARSRRLAEANRPFRLSRNVPRVRSVGKRQAQR